MFLCSDLDLSKIWVIFGKDFQMFDGKYTPDYIVEFHYQDIVWIKNRIILDYC